jgi:hypothetical protein
VSTHPPRMAVAENGNLRVERNLAPHSGYWGRCVSQFRWWRGLTTGYFLAPPFGVQDAGGALEKA